MYINYKIGTILRQGNRSKGLHYMYINYKIGTIKSIFHGDTACAILAGS